MKYEDMSIYQKFNKFRALGYSIPKIRDTLGINGMSLNKLITHISETKTMGPFYYEMLLLGLHRKYVEILFLNKISTREGFKELLESGKHINNVGEKGRKDMIDFAVATRIVSVRPS